MSQARLSTITENYNLLIYLSKEIVLTITSIDSIAYTSDIQNTNGFFSLIKFVKIINYNSYNTIS